MLVFQTGNEEQIKKGEGVVLLSEEATSCACGSEHALGGGGCERK